MPDKDDLHSEAAQLFIEGKEPDESKTDRMRVRGVRQFDQWWYENRDKDILEAGWRDIRSFFQDRANDGLAPQTLRSLRDTLKVFYQEYVGPNEPLGRNPLNSVEKWSRHVDSYGTATKKAEYAGNDDGVIYLSREETRKLRENVPNPQVRNELLIKLMVQTGARRNEVSTITLDDLDREERRVTLHDDKTGKPRTVPFTDLSPELDLWLNKYRHGYNPASRSEYLFVTERSEQLHRHQVNEIVKDAAESAGVQEVMYTDAQGRNRHRVTAHTLRHTYAIRMTEQDIPIRYLQELMGHVDIKETQIYLNITDDKAAEEYHRIDPSFEA